MGRGSSEQSPFAPGPRRGVEHLKMLIEEFDEFTDPADLARLFDRLRTLPVPIATELGEKLDVYPEKRGHDKTKLEWEFRIVGNETGAEYGVLRLRFLGDDVKDVPLELIGLQIKVAMHHPSDLDDDVFEAAHRLAVLDGHTLQLRCSTCGASFITYREVVAHEQDAHGQDTADKRPRIQDTA